MYYDEKLDCWIWVAETDGILPNRVNGLVTVDADGTYIMLINNKLSYTAKLDAFEHEKKHIEQGHLHSYMTASEIERGM